MIASLVVFHLFGFDFDSSALPLFQLKKGKIVKQQQQEEEEEKSGNNGSTAADDPKGECKEDGFFA